jgi:hypothetical protein
MAAVAGTGIGLMAHWAVGPQPEAGKVVVRRQWQAVSLRSQPSAQHLVEFLQLLSNFSPRQARLRA